MMRRNFSEQEQRAGLHQKKSLGQVFLTTDWPTQRMTDKLKDWQVQRVLEIGPGPGILTRTLLRAGLDVTAVEKDERFAERLQQHLGDSDTANHLQVVRADILKFDLEAWIAAAPGTAAVVGNIPYNISSPILLKILPLLHQLSGLILMTQLEFAARVAASPNTKDYGSLSVFTQLRALVNFEFKVDRTSFKPVPKVDSAVICMQALKKQWPATVLGKVELIARAAFSQRRKKLRNSVRQFFYEAGMEARSPIDLERRAETLTPDEFVTLAEFLVKSELGPS